LKALIVPGETVAFNVRFGAGVVGINVDGDVGFSGSVGDRRGAGDSEDGKKWEKLEQVSEGDGVRRGDGQTMV